MLAIIIIASFNFSTTNSKKIIELPEKAFVSLEPEIMAPIKDINIENGIVLTSLNSPLFINNISFGTKFSQVNEESLKKDII